MHNRNTQDSDMKTLSAEEIQQVAGGVQFGTLGLDPDGRYKIVPSTSGSPIYAKILGKWTPLGTEPFIGPAASELER
jgi:hypothetical protein